MTNNEWDDFKKLVSPLKKTRETSRTKKSLPKKVEQQVDNKYLLKDLDIQISEDWGVLEKNLLKDILKGKKRISASLDLHGYNVNDSKKLVFDFISNNYILQNRLLLLITGKGERLEVDQGWRGIGKLREKLPQWLNSLALAKKILWFDHAPPDKGVQGAFLIYLRKTIK